MKRALQAILIAGEKMMTDVILDKKQITIREGYRDYTHGPVMIGCDILNWARMRTITSVEHKLLKNVSLSDLRADGFSNVSEAINLLKKFYPNIDENSEVTVIRLE